jgi:hypothetical protein
MTGRWPDRRVGYAAHRLAALLSIFSAKTEPGRTPRAADIRMHRRRNKRKSQLELSAIRSRKFSSCAAGETNQL